MRDARILIIPAALLLLTSCHPTENPALDTASVQTMTENPTRDTAAEEPPYIEPTRYASYDELRSALTASLPHETLFIPTIDGIPAILRDEDGFPSVTHFEAELYNRPWIWYHCEVDGVRLIVKTMHLAEDEQTTDDASELIREIAPNAPNIDNYAEFANYKRIYLVERELADTSVQVMVSETKDGQRHFYAFVYENMLVGLQSNDDLLESDIFARLSFDEVEME